MLFGLFAGLAALFAGLIILPLMLVGLVLWIPLLILKLTLRLVFGLILLPFILLGMFVAFIAGTVPLVIGVLAPLLPLLILGGCAWLLWRLLSGERFRLPA